MVVLCPYGPPCGFAPFEKRYVCVNCVVLRVRRFVGWKIRSGPKGDGHSRERRASRSGRFFHVTSLADEKTRESYHCPPWIPRHWPRRPPRWPRRRSRPRRPRWLEAAPAPYPTELWTFTVWSCTTKRSSTMSISMQFCPQWLSLAQRAYACAFCTTTSSSTETRVRDKARPRFFSFLGVGGGYLPAGVGVVGIRPSGELAWGRNDAKSQLPQRKRRYSLPFSVDFYTGHLHSLASLAFRRIFDVTSRIAPLTNELKTRFRNRKTADWFRA